MISLSRGGVRFVAQEPVSAGARLDLEVALPDGDGPLRLSGRVRHSWRATSHRFDVSVQFEPYGDRPDANPLAALHRLVDLESRHLAGEPGRGRLALAGPVDVSALPATACA